MARSTKQSGSVQKEEAAKTTTAAARLEEHATDPLAGPAGHRAQPARPVRRARLDVGAAPRARTDKTDAPKAEAKPTRGNAAKPISQGTTPAPHAGTKPSTPRTSAPRPGKRPSALDAAARVLAGLSKAESKTGLTAADLIERMSKAKLWTSPGGKTPAATLYAAMTREITKKGPAARFARPGPGRFTASTSMGASARKNGGAK